ncbi:MAG: hypothetical protein RSD85_00995 [Erysipelotrichaceae bacterium]
MLLKLLKMDLKGTYRIFIGMYVAMFVCVLLQLLKVDTINNIASIIYVLLMTGLFFVAIGSLIIYYNKTMFKSQAFLTHTLPASEGQVLASKLIVSVMWTILTFIVLYSSLFLLVVITGGNSFSECINSYEFHELLRYMRLELGDIVIFIIRSIGQTIGATLLIFSLIYMALSFVNTRFVKKYKNFFAILIVFGLTWILGYVNETIFRSIDNDFLELLITFIIPNIILIGITLFINKHYIEVENV